jgi:hypothetical protein
MGGLRIWVFIIFLFHLFDNMLLSTLFLTKLAPEPAYEAYVKAAGIDGNTDFHIDEMYGCPKPPCPGGWDFPSSKGMPASVFGFGQQVTIRRS